MGGATKVKYKIKNTNTSSNTNANTNSSKAASKKTKRAKQVLELGKSIKPTKRDYLLQDVSMMET